MIRANYHYRVSVRSKPFPPQDHTGTSCEYAVSFEHILLAEAWQRLQEKQGKFTKLTQCLGPMPKPGRPEECGKEKLDG